ncbi:MAG: hypothetical protein ABSE62_07595 [Chthoniobacteraceae bacterium]|jgi:hypothetical protein
MRDANIPLGHILKNAPCVKSIIPNHFSVSGSTIQSGPTGLPPSYLLPPPPLAGHVVIHAHGLPPDTKVTYALDGVDLHTVTTDSAGNLILFLEQGLSYDPRKIPSGLDLFAVRTLTLHDHAGHVLARANF